MEKTKKKFKVEDYQIGEALLRTYDIDPKEYAG